MIKWNDGYNAPWDASVNVDPRTGDGNTTISVSDVENDKLDRETKVIVQSDVNPELVEEVSIKQKGLQVPFCTGDGVPFFTGDGSTVNVKKVRGIASWDSEDPSPKSNGFDGNKDVVPDWNFYLIDTTKNTGEKIKPVGKLKKNNLLRFEDGSFAPTVGITEAMRAECDVELYLDAAHQNKYCDAGGFDAVKFYNEHGMAKLYNASGEEVRVLRPWETTSTDYTIGLACDKDLVVVDGAILPNGKQWRGVIQKGYENSFGDYTDTSKYPVLPPTAISPAPPCSIGGKLRSFFYLYEGEANCKSAAAISSSGNIFANGRTYPLVNNSVPSFMQKARANNADANLSYPFAEGGYFAYNAYVCYLEMIYGDKYLHNSSFFGSGISSNEGRANDSNWNIIGGVRYKVNGASEWKYDAWSSTPTDLYYSSDGLKTYWSNIINQEYPKEQCMESHMVASFAIERGIQEDEEFDFYGSTYWYKNVPIPFDFVKEDMNVRVYKKMSGNLSLFNVDGAAVSVDLEIILRMSLFGGANLSGDIFRYWQGGYETVGTKVKDINSNQGETRRGHSIKIYMNPDQKSWHSETVIQKSDGGVFDFESTYPFIGDAVNLGNSYAKRRMPLTAWKTENGGALSNRECSFYWDDCYWATESTPINTRLRVAARFGGYAYSGFCSPRTLHAFYAVSSASRYSAGSAQCLLDVSDAG